MQGHEVSRPKGNHAHAAALVMICHSISEEEHDIRSYERTQLVVEAHCQKKLKTL
nr:hypothetical protein RKHAN_00244 [Rhizobium sp. Khangiran2]